MEYRLAHICDKRRAQAGEQGPGAYTSKIPGVNDLLKVTCPVRGWNPGPLAAAPVFFHYL